MAEFNPQIKDSNVNDYTSMSRGGGVDYSKGTALSGFGDALKGFLGAGDTYIQDRIEYDSRYAFDTLNNEINMGLDTAKDLTDGNSNTPPGLTRSAEGLSTLAAAHQQGQVTEEYYYARLASTMKGLRAKYPGYEKEVDNILQQVTGVRPANAFRDLLMNNLKAAQKASATAADKLDREFQSNAQYMDSEVYNWANGQGTSEAYQIAIQNAYNNRQRAYALENENKEIAAGRTRADDAYNRIVSQESIIISDEFNSTLTQFGLTFENMGSTLSNLNPEQQAGLLGALQKQTIAVEQRLLEAASHEDFNTLDRQSIQKRIDTVTRPFKELAKSIKDGDFTQTTLLTQIIKNKDANASMALYQDKTYVLSKQLGQVGMQSWMNDQLAKNNGDLSKALTGFAEAMGGGRTISQQITLQELSGDSPAKIAQDTMTKVTLGLNLLANGDLSPEDTSEVLKAIYNPETRRKLWGMVETNQSQQLYDTLYNNEVLSKLKSQGEEGVKQYIEAAGADILNTTQGSSLIRKINNSVQEADASVTLDLNENGDLELFIDKEAFKNEASRTGYGNKMYNRVRNLQENIDSLNQVVQPYKSLLKNSGLEDEESLSSVYSSFGLDLSSERDILPERRSTSISPTGGALAISPLDTDQALKDYRTLPSKGEEARSSKESSLETKSNYAPESSGTEASKAIEDIIKEDEKRGANLFNGNDTSNLHPNTQEIISNYAEFPDSFISNIEKYEAGRWGYDSSLANWAQKNGQKVSEMSLSEIYDMTAPGSQYARDSKRLNREGRMATPVGKYQIVGRTLRRVAKEMNLPEDTVFTPAVQDAMAAHLLRERTFKNGKVVPFSKWKTSIVSEWDGFKNLSVSEKKQIYDDVLASYEG